MTLEQKRDFCIKFCDGMEDCEECIFDNDPTKLCTEYSWLNVPEELIEYAYKKITGGTSVNHPSHYNQGGIECIDAMVSAFGKEAVENFCLCNAFKYVWRNRDKNGFEDIDKAIWYLTKIKELINNA